MRQRLSQTQVFSFSKFGEVKAGPASGSEVGWHLGSEHPGMRASRAPGRWGRTWSPVRVAVARMANAPPVSLPAAAS